MTRRCGELKTFPSAISGSAFHQGLDRGPLPAADGNGFFQAFEAHDPVRLSGGVSRFADSRLYLRPAADETPRYEAAAMHAHEHVRQFLLELAQAVVDEEFRGARFRRD